MRASEVVDLVNFDVQRECDIVTQQFKPGIAQQVQHVIAAAGKKIVHAENIVPVSEKPLTQMTAEKTRPACYQNTGT